MYLLGFDIGSSSVKAALVRADTGAAVASAQSPEAEMSIQAPQPGWAEQHPADWWEHLCHATRTLLARTGADPQTILGIGITYQMHGLVAVDRHQQPLRPAIIWCDSRAVDIGNQAFEAIGPDRCLRHLLNSPGNFTASKLKWMQDHERERYAQIHRILLPGDYIAMRLTGEILTTAGGLSEGMLWDFQHDQPAQLLLDHYGIDPDLLPPLTGTFALQGRVTADAAAATGLAPGTPVCYRAGDQPNNALALNVLESGEIAATAGTSGVVYGVVDRPLYDPKSRVNGFAHVNHTPEDPRIGILLCINGTGIQHRWMRQQVAQEGVSYGDMERLAATVPPGADGLRILPFGNGAERMLDNRAPGAGIFGLDFNRHGRPHLFRAALEGIAFAFVYGVRILQDLGLDTRLIRAGHDNLFQSAVFTDTLAALLGSRIELLESTGAIGAARAAGVAAGIFTTPREAAAGVRTLRQIEPTAPSEALQATWSDWESLLHNILRD